jgi:hypothetical protein
MSDFEIKAYSKKELRLKYKIGRGTFYKWLKRIPDFDPNTGKIFTPAQVQQIVDHLGTP